MIKICTACKKEKDISEFSINTRKDRKGNIKKYIRIYCKECNNLKAKLWRQENPNSIKEYNSRETTKIRKKNTKPKNPEKRKEYERQYYLNNLDKIKEKAKTAKVRERKRIYKKNRRKNDLLFKMRGNISNAILKALKKGKSNKAGQSILQYLSYTIKDLKLHLEKQFNNDINWDNYGKSWHIDHIIPQSDLLYTSMEDENFKICWSLENLRPLDAIQNVKEGANRIRHKKHNNM